MKTLTLLLILLCSTAYAGATKLEPGAAKTIATKRIVAHFPPQPYSINGGPRYQVAELELAAENEVAYRFMTTVTKILGDEQASFTLASYVLKADGRFFLGAIEGMERGIPRYVTLTRVAEKVLSLLSTLSGDKAQRVPGEDHYAKTYGDYYYTLHFFFGQRILAAIPIKPDLSKLPAWAQQVLRRGEDHYLERMFPEAFPVTFVTEQQLRAGQDVAPYLLQGVQLYPTFARSVGIEPSPEIQPIKLTGWACREQVCAQDCRERTAADLLLALKLFRNITTYGDVEVMLFGGGNYNDTVLATFSNTSIHHEVQFGRLIAGTQTRSNGESVETVAELILKGNPDSSIPDLVLNVPALRALLESAAVEDATAAVALARIPALNTLP
ncbi:MAG: hypothetical protein A2284_10515 [Deltaproteobacteria bacterium RIFOXYA12_FULL_61_11]|nr:MAG: hypothetical protein A2284_10515 [Deltaproteobacteria bacterium RIFOXYA12_FULL_61_11]